MRHSIKQILILLKLEYTLGSQGKTSKKPEKQMIYSISNPNALTKSLFFRRKKTTRKKWYAYYYYGWYKVSTLSLPQQAALLQRFVKQ